MFRVALEEFEQVFSLFMYRYMCNYLLHCELPMHIYNAETFWTSLVLYIKGNAGSFDETFPRRGL